MRFPSLSVAALRGLAIVAVACLVIYVPSLGSPLFFDDEYLLSGELFRLYSGLQLRERLLSYGSFVWLNALLGEGWGTQRAVNVLLHVAVVGALWGFYRELLRHIDFAKESASEPAGKAEDSHALLLAIGFFALNPVAVYAVAYLIQRSILMATLFVLVALWSFTRGLASGRLGWHVLAVVAYVLAVASKEHALFAPLAAVPLFVVVRRPGARSLALLGGAMLALGGAATGLVYWRYGHIIGKPFDEFSAIYLKQLSALSPDAMSRAWPLSIMNQAYLFFEYGLRWLVPWSGWMSINMRPVFPLTFTTFPHLLGPIAYLALVAGGAWLVLRYRDSRSLLGLSLLLPSLLFATEFATVWVQDPFALYRSYLWAIGVPGLVFLLLHGFPGRVIAAVAVVLGSLLAWQSLDRVFSMSTPERLYTDAIAKLPNDPRAVGRWFPYLNRGNVYFDAKQYQLAERDFRASSALGDAGMGTFNIGSLRLNAGDANAALAAYAEAERQGYTAFNLPMQRGVALASLGRLEEAYAQFQAAMAMNPTSPGREAMLGQMGRIALQLGKPVEAANWAKAVLAVDKRNREAGTTLAMALIAQRDFQTAARLLNIMIAEAPAGMLHYARAMAFAGLGEKAAAKADIEAALRLGTDNPVVREWQKKIEAMR